MEGAAEVGMVGDSWGWEQEWRCGVREAGARAEGGNEGSKRGDSLGEGKRECRRK